MKIVLNDEMIKAIKKGNVKAYDLVKFVLQNTFLHFKVQDIKGNLTRENVYSQLSLNKIYNDEEKNIKKAYIKNNVLVLEF